MCIRDSFNTKTNHVRRFLEAGHKVKVTIMFRGRERTHPELGERILVRVAEALEGVGVAESKPSMMGMDMNMVMAPKPGAVKKNVKAEDIEAIEAEEAAANAAEAQAAPEAETETASANA